MSLERHGDRHVYTRSRRVNGRIIREYVASGESAILAAELDAEERRAKQEARKAIFSPITQTDECLSALSEANPFRFLSLYLVASGCLRKNGSWA